MSPRDWLRGAEGLALLTAPRPALEAVYGAGLGDTGALVIRVLGARQLGQAALAASPWGPDLVVPGALVDLTHAATAFALAGVDRSRARAGLIEGVVAVSYAVWALSSRSKT